MAHMLMFIGGVWTVSVTFQQSAFPRRLCAGKRGLPWCQRYVLAALANANSVGSRPICHTTVLGFAGFSMSSRGRWIH